eukprot:TRINITY_DN48312_c0_g1_i1.p1 TRINITY_DN48312_c0_g1~~TRINITY_DN48312_c0_g1_i1.p1  ORF type:complete len:863 (-),score=215.50 TRINITY_DN48312_c0_g1_i1:158-2746(-)
MAARGEAAPKTASSGLNAADRIKQERERLHTNPENEEDCLIDELQWKANVTDLHRDMEVAKSLWLLLEHSNEAAVRTALEIAVDKQTKKVLWWPDFWFSDHDKREYFKEIVGVKLAIAIANAKGAAVDLSEFNKGDDAESELVASLRKQIAELEAALRAARAAQAAAEARCRQLEQEAEEAANRLRALEQAMDKMRGEVKAEKKEEPVVQDNSKYQDEINRLKQQIKMGEEQIAKLQEEIKKLKAQLGGKGEAPKEVTQSSGGGTDPGAEKRIQELEARIKKLLAEIAKLKREKPDVQEQETVEVAETDDSELRALRAELEAERRRREELEAQIGRLQEQIENLKKEIELEKKRAADLQAEMKRLLASHQGTKPTQVVQEAAPQVVEVTGMSAEQLAELEELRRIAAEVEKLKAKLKKRDQQIASLQEENERLNDEQMKLLKMLKQVREQLRIVMELAEKRGLGDVIKKLFEEAGLADTMADPEYTCFDRLYDDALRRMDKQRRLEWFRLGNTGEPPPSFKGRSPYTRKGSSSPSRGVGPIGSSDAAGGVTSGVVAFCRNCGYPVQQASFVPAGRPESISPSPTPLVHRSPSPYESQGQDRHLLYEQPQRSANTLTTGRLHSGHHPGHQPHHPQARSPSPVSAHAMDMRIEMVKPAAPGHIATAVATFTEDPPSWDPYAGRLGLGRGGGGGAVAGRDVVPFPRDGRPGQMMAKSANNFRGRQPELAPLEQPASGHRATSRSPERHVQGSPMAGAGRRLAPSSSAGALPRLPADMMSPSKGRSMAGSSSAADFRSGAAGGFMEGPLPPSGHGPGRMRGVMLVERPPAHHFGHSAEEFGPRMLWRPHKTPSPDTHYKPPQADFF